MTNTSILSARAKRGHIGESCTGIRFPILVLLQGPGEANREARNRLIFDEFACGKVSFPAQLSVK
jgi:hypothetical protein